MWGARGKSRRQQARPARCEETAKERISECIESRVNHLAKIDKAKIRVNQGIREGSPIKRISDSEDAPNYFRKSGNYWFLNQRNQWDGRLDPV